MTPSPSGKLERFRIVMGDPAFRFDGLLASALALLPDAGRALLDPRSLAAYESEWIRSAAARLWCAAAGQPPQVGHRLVADPSQNVRRSLAFHLPGTPQYDDVRNKLRQDNRRSVRIALKAAA